MKQYAVILLALTTLTGVARAGVVVEEQQVTNRGVGEPVTHKITVMVQGNKQKSVIDDGKQSLVTNLDQGTRLMIYDSRKTYIEMPFPPKGMATAPNQSGLAFKKTGTHQKISGFDCDDYTGTGTVSGSELTVNGCFSKTAPGAANFTTFQKTMSEKVKGTAMALMSAAPEGIPLKIDTTMKMPGMPQMANRPPMATHMTVSKVTEKELAADIFEAPKGYTKQQMPMMGAMGHAPMAMGPGGTVKPPKPVTPPNAAGAASPAAAPNKVPE
jgi:hypothetical protein